jgi:pimeloyl-ACP methyl ester carboxylesterase
VKTPLKPTEDKNFANKADSGYRGKNIHFQVSGKGPAIVLLHGFLESGMMWENFVRRLSSSFTVITIDLPGHGKSGVLSAIHTMDEMAEAVHWVLKSQNISKCLMAGHSMGGYVTLAFAEKYPRMLKGLILFHSHAAADSPEVLLYRERTIKLVQKDHLGFIRNFIPDLFDPENVSRYEKEIHILGEMALKTSKEGIIAALEGIKNRPDRQHVLINSSAPSSLLSVKMTTVFPRNLHSPRHISRPTVKSCCWTMSDTWAL